MAIYVGETIAIRAVATDPFDGLPLVDLDGEVEVYEQGQVPKSNPDERVVRGPAHTMVYDPESAGYMAYIPTGGFDAGKWHYRVRLWGPDHDTWEYGAFTLKP